MTRPETETLLSAANVARHYGDHALAEALLRLLRRRAEALPPMPRAERTLAECIAIATDASRADDDCSPEGGVHGGRS